MRFILTFIISLQCKRNVISKSNQINENDFNINSKNYILLTKMAKNMNLCIKLTNGILDSWSLLGKKNIDPYFFLPIAYQFYIIPTNSKGLPANDEIRKVRKLVLVYVSSNQFQIQMHR